MEYHDWIPTYPVITDPLFQTKLAAKKEFQLVSSSVNEPAPKNPGEFFKYQLFDKQFMRIYDRLLMFYEAGTGKTCGYLSVAEDYHMASMTRLNMLTDALVDYYNTYQGTIKNVYVLLKGKSLKQELQKQLLCKCTDGTYLTENILKAKTDKAQKSAVTRSINTWYTLDTYIPFVNKILREKLTDEQIAERFNGCIFICDEIHSVKYELIGDDEELLDEELEEEDQDEDQEDVFGGETKKKKREATVYETLYRVFHAPKWCKVILATATPMINDANDLIDPMNLILPKNKKIPKNTDLKKWSLEQYKETMMGYISFIRAGDTGVDTVFEGKPLDRIFIMPDGTKDPSQLKVEQYKMLKFQSDIYLDVVKQKKKGVRNDERQVTAFVFPDGSYGGTFPRLKGGTNKKGLGKYVISDAQDEYSPTEEFIEATNSIQKIKKLSVIYAAIVEKCMNAPGLCFIYEELLKGSGAIALAMCFESMGYTRFNQYSSAFEGTKSSRVPPYCGGESGSQKITISKKLRYGMISSETSELKDEKLLELFRSEENKYGDYCKILIGSKVTRDGINLANVQDVFLPSMWTPSGMYQAMQRAIRATSHVSLIKDSPNGRVKVHIHRMGAFAEESNGSIVSVDLDMYAIAEAKDRDIAIVRRNVRKVAADCIIQKARNQREPARLNGTAICDYQECQFECANPDPEETDYSTYRLFYSDKEIEEIITVIQKVFSVISNFILTEFIEKYELDYVLTQMAISKLIQDKTIIYNRFGNPCLISSKGYTVFLVPLSLTKISYLDNYYSSVMLATYTQELKDYVAQRIKTQEEGAIPVGGGSIDANALAMESAVLKEMKNLSENESYVVDRFKNYLYTFKEPTEELAKEKENRLGKGKGRGRKPIEGKINYRPDTLSEKAEKGEEIILHTIYTIPTESTSYNVAPKFMNAEGRLRLLKPSEKVGWRDANIDENVVYNALIRGRINNLMKKYYDAKLFGSILSDNEFRIHDLRGVVINMKDQRTIPKGRACSESWKNDDLLLIAYEIGIKAPINRTTKQPYGVNISKNDLLNDLENRKEFKNREENLRGYSLDQLRYLYSWSMSNFNRTELCNVMRKQFEKNGLLFIA